MAARSRAALARGQYAGRVRRWRRPAWLRQAGRLGGGRRRHGRPARPSIPQDHPALAHRMLLGWKREWEPHLELGLAWLRGEGNRAAVLLHDDGVADVESQATAYTGRLRGKEGIEYVRLHRRR